MFDKQHGGSLIGFTCPSIHHAVALSGADVGCCLLLQAWSAQGKRGIWLKVPSALS
jgi:hypothetical protein